LAGSIPERYWGAIKMILAIESTCDETGAAVVKKKQSGNGVEVIVNITASSAEMHNKYGGIVPEVAAREQLRVIGSVIEEAMNKAGLKYELMVLG